MIRPTTKDDIPAIRLFDEFSNFRLDEATEGRMHVFEKSGIVAGYISLAREPFHGLPLIEFLCVRPDFRRSGIASALLDHVESLFPSRRIFTSTEQWNNPMHRLLTSRGYVPAGLLTGLNEDGSAEVYYYYDVPSNP